MPGKSKDELYQQVTDRIVEALEAGANGSKWSAPWHASAATLVEHADKSVLALNDENEEVTA